MQVLTHSGTSSIFRFSCDLTFDEPVKSHFYHLVILAQAGISSLMNCNNNDFEISAFAGMTDFYDASAFYGFTD
jgi:hypothetical protein